MRVLRKHGVKITEIKINGMIPNYQFSMLTFISNWILEIFTHTFIK